MVNQQTKELPAELPDDLRDGRSRGSFRRRLLNWFRQHARDLPWRRTRDPYHIWVSEIMLQQTQVSTVTGYFARFIERFPTMQSLADAREQEVLRLWEGLGYYRRARQLHAAAQLVVERYGGEFPREFQQVRALPGIGRYTAGAILSIAFDESHPILEANTTRLLARLIGFRDDVTRSAGQRILWTAAELLVPKRRAGEFNQAMMEVGSEICTPRQPHCEQCPIRLFCAASRHGWQEEIPKAKVRSPSIALREAAIVIRRHQKVLVRRCREGERWAGLWDFPRFEVVAGHGPKIIGELQRKVNETTGLDVVITRKLAKINHSVTRYRIQLSCHEATCDAGCAPSGEHTWIDLSELASLPLSTTGRKIAQLIQ
jgi:A/G-specific adenine glycosylase